MKTDLEQLIDTAKQLCDRLEQAAKDEQKFCEELESEFEKMSWDAFRIMEEIKMIKRYKELQEEAG